MKPIRFLAAPILAALAGTAYAQPDLVTNGGFETGSLANWTQFGNTGFSGVINTIVHSGTWSGRFGPTVAPGGIQQTLAATTGQVVLVEFWYQAQGVGANVNNSFSAALGGQTLVSFTNDTSHTSWTQLSYISTVPLDNPVLEFTFFNVPDYDYIDDIHVYTSGFGACCLGDGTCAYRTATSCTAAGGLYRGDGSDCAIANCPTGACCIADGSCIVTGPGGCLARNGIYRGDNVTCALASCVPQTFITVPLNWNFNGLVHGASEQGTTNRDNPNGYRSVADRGLLLDGSAGTINAGPIVDPDFMPFTLVSQAGQLDIVCLGDRRFVANAARAWGTGTENGLQPAWLPASDLTGPQITSLASLHPVFSPQASLGILYQISDGGGRFDVVLKFTDNSSATVTVRAPDWYGDLTPPAPGAGVAAQRKLGVYTATGSADLANLNNPLNVAEAVINVNSLQAAGFGNFAGKQLVSITFQNPISNTTTYANSTLANASGIAIIAATLGGVNSGSSCYANCDSSSNPPILNALDFGCFLTKYAQGDTYANCDDSSNPPILNALDFGCFLTKYAAGCT